MEPYKNTNKTGSRGLAGPVLVFGFGMAVLLWVAAFLTHLPWMNLPGSVSGPILIALWLAAAIAAGRAASNPAPLKVGLGAGLVSAALCLLILGSILVEAPTGDTPAPGVRGLRPSAAVFMPLFLALGAVVGATGGFIGQRFRRDPGTAHPPSPTHPADWLARFAIVAAVAVLPLLLIGGAVTSTDSGMAIVGWPDSQGAGMFLYPLALMADPGRFLEHSHRLFGTLVGLTTFTLMVFTLLRGQNRGVKAWAVFLFILVVAQGALGGSRVIADSRYAGLVHGVLAQLFFGSTVALAVLLHPAYRAAGPLPALGAGPRLRLFATGLLHATILQLAMGAAFRHLKFARLADTHEAALSAPARGANHALWGHVGFSVAVVLLAAATGFLLIGAAREDHKHARILGNLGRNLLGAVGLQFLLGWAVLWTTLSFLTSHAAAAREPTPGASSSWVYSVSSTVHQGNGALILAMATAAFLWARRLAPRTPGRRA